MRAAENPLQHRENMQIGKKIRKNKKITFSRKEGDFEEKAKQIQLKFKVAAVYLTFVNYR